MTVIPPGVTVIGTVFAVNNEPKDYEAIQVNILLILFKI